MVRAFLWMLVPGGMAAVAVAATGNGMPANQIPITQLSQNNSIYTDLNQQFPHAGTGVPGSGVGTPNASFLFDPSAGAVAAAGYAPSYINGSNLANNGVDFLLSSDANGYDFNNFGGAGTVNPCVVPVNQNDIGAVHLLMGAYFGRYIDVTFTGADGATETFNTILVPDFNGGGSINQTINGYADQTVFAVLDIGAGGTGNSSNGAYNNYFLTEVSFHLNPTLAQESLTSISINSSGFDALLLGATVVPQILGDADGNGAVDASDLAIVNNNLGKSVSGYYLSGDFNDDGAVNADDLMLYMLGLAQFNGAVEQPLPEPGCALAISGAIVLLARRARAAQW